MLCSSCINHQLAGEVDHSVCYSSRIISRAGPCIAYDSPWSY